MEKILILSLLIIGLVAISVLLLALWYTNRNKNYFARIMSRVSHAEYQEKSAEINNSFISYLEGPKNGPPLLLVHGQSIDKYNYGPALAKLSRKFHVYAVDCYGHGKSSHDLEKYSNAAMGKDLLSFIENIIGNPIFLSGHSSGGLIATWLAANGGGFVKAVLLEDPPFFTLDRPRTEKTWNWVDLASSSHNYIKEGETDWVMYQARNARMWSFFGKGKEFFLTEAGKYHKEKPSAPLLWIWLPPLLNESFRGIPNYDPRFGDVFYKGEWEKGFDLETALRSITIPVIYQRSEAEIDEDGILRGATSESESERAISLIKNVNYYTDKSAHSWHWSKPAEFVSRLLELKELAAKHD